MEATETKGAISTLFDLSFTEFITPRFIKFLYVLGILFAGIMSLLIIIGGFKANIILGVLALVLSPLFFILYVLCARVYCELIMVAFRIASNTDRLVEQGKA